MSSCMLVQLGLTTDMLLKTRAHMKRMLTWNTVMDLLPYKYENENPSAAKHITLLGHTRDMLYSAPLKVVREQARGIRFCSFHNYLLANSNSPKIITVLLTGITKNISYHLLHLELTIRYNILTVLKSKGGQF